MQVFVDFQQVARRICAVDAAPSNPIGEWKSSVIQAADLDSSRLNEFRLLHRGKFLNEDKTLRESDVRNGDTISFHVSLRGGMPKKAKKKKEKPEGGTSASAHAEPEEEDFPDLDIRPERWINLQVKLTTWEHLNFSILLRTSTRLYTIVEKIKERHGGSIKDISLYKHQVKADNSLPDLGCTLDEVGFEGGTQDDPRTEVLEYDYKAHDSDCALLLSSPRGASRKDVARKVQAELENEARMRAAAATAAVAVSGRRKSMAYEEEPKEA